jgi:class 3 adenylate cyclase
MVATPADIPTRTLVCSVLFIDIVGYSKTGVGDQVKAKNTFNRVLSNALEQVPPRDRVVVDTGDGAAVTFLGDPEGALFVALALLDKVGELPVRLGINLGPVSLMKDINGLDNVVGDGINAAERVMSFAQPGQLLVSRSFYEVMSLLSKDYAALFRQEAPRTDKHDRAHELYAVSEAVRVGRRVQEAQARLRTQRHAVPAPEADDSPAQVFDAGTHYIVSGHSQARVHEAVKQLALQGGRMMARPAQVGSKWIASVANPRLSVQARVEALGFKRVITGPTLESVQLKVQDLLELGAVLVRRPELDDGVWTAVCEKT